MQNLVAQTLSSVTLGTPVFHENITMIPLRLAAPPLAQGRPRHADDEGEVSYLTLDEALALGWTEITEISDQGRVPELRVINKGAKPVFILDGEELVGAKQNRIVNLSILVPAASTLTIPVSCVEAGRWRARSHAFSAAPRTQYATGRAKRMAQVTMAMQIEGMRYSDQAEVWADIAAKSQRMGAESATGAMDQIFADHAAFADACVDALAPTDGQFGALFLLEGRVVGLDLFDRAATLRRLLPKLVRSVAVDAVEQRAGESLKVKASLALKVAEHFLAAVCAASAQESEALGLGRDIRISTPVISGGALAVESSVVHVSAFHL